MSAHPKSRKLATPSALDPPASSAGLADSPGRAINSASAPAARTAALASPALGSPEDHAVWQQAHDALQAALEQGNLSLDQTRDKANRKLLNAFLDTISNELTALNREDMESHTISLQAATHQLGAGITDLKSLREQIENISDAIADAAKVVTAIDTVLSGLQSFLGTFAAL